MSCHLGFLWLLTLVLLYSNFDHMIQRTGSCCQFRFFFILMSHALMFVLLVSWSAKVIFSEGYPDASKTGCNYNFWTSSFVIEIVMIFFTIGLVVITIVNLVKTLQLPKHLPTFPSTEENGMEMVDYNEEDWDWDQPDDEPPAPVPESGDLPEYTSTWLNEITTPESSGVL